MTKILVDKAVIEQALEAFEDYANQYPHMQKGYMLDAAEALRAALEQPQVEQEPVAVIGDVWTLNWVGSDPIATIVKKHGLKIGDKLYTHPQNLRCKSTQARLATLWGYEKLQPPRQPLTDEAILEVWATTKGPRHSVFKFARAIEAAHGIGESNA